MSHTLLQAKQTLRLVTEAQPTVEQIEQAFRKMIRRYPLEQFPEKFSEIRHAYEILIDPVADLRGLLFDSTLDLSSIVESFSPLNKAPQGDTETAIFKAMSGLLRANFSEIIGEDGDDFGDEWDEEDFIEILGHL